MSFLRYYAKYNHVQRSLMQFNYFRKITRLKKVFISLHLEYKMRQIIAVCFR